MRIRLSVVAALALLAVVVRVDAQAPDRVTISVDHDGRLSSAQLQLVISEVQEIWQAVGVVVTSCRFGAPPRAGEAKVLLRVVGNAPHGQPRSAGWVSLQPNGRPAPLLFVSLARVTAVLSTGEFATHAFTALPGYVRERLIARAIGRVTAHELGHYLLQSAEHRDHGLMRPEYSASDLIGESSRPFQVEALDRPAIRSEVSAPARSQSPF
jgi:hypothetical protein